MEASEVTVHYFVWFKNKLISGDVVVNGTWRNDNEFHSMVRGMIYRKYPGCTIERYSRKQ